MTAPFEIEEEEAVVLTVENSHLVRGSCVRCGASALCDPTQLAKALCTGCLGQGSAFSSGDLPHTVPVGYPLTYGHGEQESVGEREEHPPAEFCGEWESEAIPRWGLEVPDSVTKLVQFARAYGWEARVRYSRGRGQHGTTGKPTSLSHLLAVALGWHPESRREAVAVYVRPVSGSTSWTWKTVYVWGPDMAPLKINREDLDLFLESPQDCEAELRKRQRDRLKAAQDAKPCRKDCAKDHEHKRPAAKKKEDGG
jgi:hypothetical protein